MAYKTACVGSSKERQERYLHQLGDVELGGAQDLDLADEHVLQRVDAGARLLNLLACTLEPCLLSLRFVTASCAFCCNFSACFKSLRIPEALASSSAFKRRKSFCSFFIF